MLAPAIACALAPRVPDVTFESGCHWAAQIQALCRFELSIPAPPTRYLLQPHSDPAKGFLKGSSSGGAKGPPVFPIARSGSSGILGCP